MQKMIEHCSQFDRSTTTNVNVFVCTVLTLSDKNLQYHSLSYTSDLASSNANSSEAVLISAYWPSPKLGLGWCLGFSPFK